MAEEEVKEEKSEVQLEGGTYEIIRSRLENQGEELNSRIDSLNEKRREIFGSVQTKLISNERITTENNCIAQDIFVIGDQFLFGYNVTLGLKSEMAVNDIFACYTVGSICTTTSEVSESSGQATFKDGPTVINLMVMCEEGKTISKGKQAIVLKKDKGRNRYLISEVEENIFN